ncbi:hypothetical protein [Roseofilum casamattae]|uniref:Uncharacterized protein n=1 Tax=Roseofilum casamattae BLCC-M143 TaxID=3022442 RepID=A0ABT7BY27_9CYAN|nr:hypothetical protein [Roseofilum casamattae]MDJ1184075.1 hypothetical protein [Roseofilum casamattae BLCC-M143]
MPSFKRRPRQARQDKKNNTSSQFGPKPIKSVQCKAVPKPQTLPSSEENANHLRVMAPYRHSEVVQPRFAMEPPTWDKSPMESRYDRMSPQYSDRDLSRKPNASGSPEIQKKEDEQTSTNVPGRSGIQRENDPTTNFSSIQESLPPVTSDSSTVIQRAIGLEIEVPVPVDTVAQSDMTKLRDWTAAEFGYTQADDPNPDFRQPVLNYTLEDLREDYPLRADLFEEQSEEMKAQWLDEGLRARQHKQKSNWIGRMSDGHKKTYNDLGSTQIDTEAQNRAERNALEDGEEIGKVGVYYKGAIYTRLPYTRGEYNTSVDSTEEFGNVNYINLMGSRNQNRVAIAAGPHFTAQVDHDPRVNSGKAPPYSPWRDSNNSALMEIVMNPANNKDEFDLAIAEVTRFVDSVNQKTNNLRAHAHNAFGTGYNIGPFNYPNIPQFANLPQEETHNWKGSVQVNIGIDLREYSDLASWYAQSEHASTDPAINPAVADANLSDGEVEKYDAAQANIMSAVAIGEEIVGELKNEYSRLPGMGRAAKIAALGKMRGIQGFVTHIALYMMGALTMDRGSSTKNVTPILMKSPNTIALKYGFTEAEKTYYEEEKYRKKLLRKLIWKTGRQQMPMGSGDLTGSIAPRGNPLVDTNKLLPGGNLSLDTFSSKNWSGSIAGNPVTDPTAVGPTRQGNDPIAAHNAGVRGIPSVGGERGGVVAEFRQLPGLYDGPDEWKRVGYDFLKEAEARNKQGGIRPEPLVYGDEWIPVEDQFPTSPDALEDDIQHAP